MRQVEGGQSCFANSKYGVPLYYRGSYFAAADYRSSDIQYQELKQNILKQYGMSPDCINNTNLINKILKENSDFIVSKTQKTNADLALKGAHATTTLTPMQKKNVQPTSSFFFSTF